MTYNDYKQECISKNITYLSYAEWFEKQRKNFNIDEYKNTNLKSKKTTETLIKSATDKLSDNKLSQKQLNYLYNSYVTSHLYYEKINSYEEWYNSFGKFLTKSNTQDIELGEDEEIRKTPLITNKTVYERYKHDCFNEHKTPLEYSKWYEDIGKNLTDKDREELTKAPDSFYNCLPYLIKRHKRYLFHLILGTVLCMTSCFWIPFIVGFLNSLCDGSLITSNSFIANCAIGFGYICTWIYFTGVVTVPLSIFGSVTIWPLFLRKLMFYDYPDNKFHKDAYYPEILEMLKCGNIETTNAIAVLGSQLL